MATTFTTLTSDITKPVNVIFQTTLLETAKALCPYFAGTVAAEVQQHGGTLTAAWRRIENLTPTTTALSELTSTVTFMGGRSTEVPSKTDVTAAVAKYGQFIVLNEQVDLVNFNGMTDDLMKKLGISAGRSLNQLQRNEMEDNSTILRAGGAASDGTLNSKVTTTVLALAVNDLSRNDAQSFLPESDGSTNIGTVPILEGFYGACHPDAAYDIAQLTGFVSVEKYAGQVQTMQGEFGLFPVAGKSIRFVQTSDASIDTNTGATTGSSGFRSSSTKNDLYDIVVWGEDAVGSVGFGFEHIKDIYRAGDTLPAVQVITHARGTSGIADPLDEMSTMGWKSWHAAKILNTNWIYSVRVAATKLS